MSQAMVVVDHGRDSPVLGPGCIISLSLDDVEASLSAEISSELFFNMNFGDQPLSPAQITSYRTDS